VRFTIFTFTVLVSLICYSQEAKEFYGDIDEKKVEEIKGLIYTKADTSLVTGKVIRRNRKNDPKRYILVNKGKPDVRGWIRINERISMPEESTLGNVLIGSAFIAGAAMAITGNDVNIPTPSTQNKRIGSENSLRRYISNQEEYFFNAYDEMSERNDISKNLNDLNFKMNDSIEILDSNRNIKIKGSVIEAKRDGVWQEYYNNGEIRSRGLYSNGKKDGLWKEYYENGNLERKVNYKKGLKVGFLENYHIDGQLLGRINYEDGKENGLMEAYHKNGQLMIIGRFENAVQVGEWKYYNEKGELIKTENHEN
jgi:antitoxin component YwqK of YwqJK toxin-antitoxin module